MIDKDLKEKLLKLAAEKGITATTKTDERGRQVSVLMQGDRELLSVPTSTAEKLKKKL